MLEQGAIDRFLQSKTIAVVGASDQRPNFGRAIYEAFRDHGYTTFAVNPTATTVAGDPCYPTLESLPAAVDGAIVMVGPERAGMVVEAVADAHIPRVWLFKGIGSPGSMSPDVEAMARSRGLDVVAGACPMMFLEPVGAAHRVHRAIRRARGAFVAAG
jgi:predicted CoA-binding protein